MQNLHRNPGRLLLEQTSFPRSPATMKAFSVMFIIRKSCFVTPAHLVHYKLKHKSGEKMAIIFIATEKVATHSQSCFFNTNFSDREVHYEKKRTEDRPFVFVFHLSLRKCCLFLTLSLYPPKLALLRQSLYVLPDEK